VSLGYLRLVSQLSSSPPALTVYFAPTPPFGLSRLDLFLKAV